jgi:hypothetical protein
MKVSDSIMGGLGNGYGSYMFNIELTDLCKEMLKRPQMAFYLTLKTPCSTDRCYQKLQFPGIRHRTRNLRPKIQWHFSGEYSRLISSVYLLRGRRDLQEREKLRGARERLQRGQTGRGMRRWE